MIASNVAQATNLIAVGRHLDSAAARLEEAFTADRSYIRFVPWSMRSKTHEPLLAAFTEIERALAALPTDGDGGFQVARAAVERLHGSAQPDAFTRLGPARDPRSYRRERMHDMHQTATAWANVAREGARLLSDPTTTRETMRSTARAVALDVHADATVDNLTRLAALDELPTTLRPDLPVPVASLAVGALDDVRSYGFGETGQLLGTWARRDDYLTRPGFDRLAAVTELERVLATPDPDDALRVVAAIDQLPGHVRPDLPHVQNDWNWTKAQEYRNPGHHEASVDALRSRLDDIRTSAQLGAAPTSTLDDVWRVVGPAGTEVAADDLRVLRDLPGFPPSLVAADVAPTNFDVVRVRVWHDAQRLAARPGVTREDIVAELHHALDALEEPSSTFAQSRGGAGSGADLADRLEGPLARPLQVPAAEPMNAFDALVRIAAIDHLPAALRPDLPDIVGIGSRIDAAAHQSPRAFDHARDLLRLRAWAAQQPRREATVAHEIPVPDEASRSALRRFLDPTEADAAAPALSRAEQADVLVQVLGGAGSYAPRLHHAALAAAEQYLADATTTDQHVGTLIDRALELTRRNLAFTQGFDNPGYAAHPDYAELGRVADSIKLLRAFEALDTHAPPGTLTW